MLLVSRQAGTEKEEFQTICMTRDYYWVNQVQLAREDDHDVDVAM